MDLRHLALTTRRPVLDPRRSDPAYARLRPHSGWRTTVWLLYWAGLCAAARLPPATADRWTFHIADWLLHALAFAILGFLTLWRASPGVDRRRRVSPPRLFFWFGLLVAYAVVDERTQPYWGRHCQLTDWLADLVGIAVGLLAGYVLSLRRPLFSRVEP